MTSVDRRAAVNPDVRRTLLAALAGALGALTLHGLLRDSGWIVDVWLTIVVVVAPAAVVRAYRRPGAFDIWIGVVLLVPWLTLRFVPDHALLGLVPTGGTVDDLHRLLTDLHHTSSSQTAPIRSTPAVRLVVCALVGLLTALIDLVAVVGRRSALAGVPLLVVYTVSGAISRHAVAWVWFAAAAVGFLILLSLDAADDRAGWGHRVSGGGDLRGSDVWAHSAPRLGVLAIAVAVLVPFVVPLPSHNVIADALRGGGSGSGFGAGSGDGSSISPFANLQGQLKQGTNTQLMTVHITDADRPGGKTVVPFYLRLNVLDDYTAQGWRVSDHGATDAIGNSDLGRLPSNDNPPASRFTAEITIKGLRSNPPVFTNLTRVSNVLPGTDWSDQDQLLLGRSLPAGRTVVEEVDQAAPTETDLSDAPDVRSTDVGRWLQHPTLPRTVTDLVSRLTRNATGPYAAARAISNYFADPNNGFSYSLDTAPGDSGSALVDFLTNRQGYCQQYAAAMAIMLRQAQVPARVVLGYMHAAPDKDGTFTVMSHDAHAWVEAYFSGLGWIPFDPTPIDGLSGGASSDLAWAPHDYPSASAGSGGRDTASRSVSSSAAAPRPSAQAPTTAPTATAAPASAGAGWSQLYTVLITIAVLLVLALVPAAVREQRRRGRWRRARNGDADALWTELADTAVDLGYVWSSARTPRQVADWLGADADGGQTTLSALAVAVERRRYGRGGPDTSAAELVGPVRQVTQTLRTRRSTHTRIAARFWPASLGWRPGGRLRSALGRLRPRRRH